VESGRRALTALLADPATRSRAAWALGVDAASRRDTIALQRWSDSLEIEPSDTIAARLATSLNAFDRGTRGMHQEALQVSETAVRFDSAGRGGDPFARALLHLERALWYDSLGRPDDADRERLWYEHFEFIGFPMKEAQSGEIDWALSTFARLLRARAAEQSDDRDRACRFFARVSELWTGADPAYRALRAEADDYAQQRCR
jgi:hypothetical protein